MIAKDERYRAPAIINNRKDFLKVPGACQFPVRCAIWNSTGLLTLPGP